jgi:hypothetical protein
MGHIDRSVRPFAEVLELNNGKGTCRSRGLHSGGHDHDHSGRRALAAVFGHPSHAEGVQRACFPDIHKALKVLKEKVGMEVLIDGVNEQGAVTHMLVNPSSGHWAYVLEIPART